MKKELNSRITVKRGIILIVFTILLIISLNSVYILEASDYKSDKYLRSWKIQNYDRFSIKHIHSVQLVPVIETYSINRNGDIILEESYFHSYGAGLPATTPYDFSITENGFKIYNINEKMDNLIYRTGAVKAEHQIYINKHYEAFLDFSEPRTSVKFDVKKISFLKQLLREVFQ